MIPTSILLILIPIFMIWNNWPDLIEKIGMFLVAHAKAIRSRKQKYEALMQKAGEVL